ncbi:MAG TPA: sugar phosphate isomerase/epimerase [Acidobacteriaceae bacterium]|nr:sugar phosphate isomerase/epimerase [Acidobacteriaceae bacterium]
MKLGLFTAVFNNLSLEEALTSIQRWPEITMLEIGTGGWPGSPHLDVAALLGNRERISAYKHQLADAGLGISALSCHGNAVHPDPAIAERDDHVFRQTVELAEQMEVPVVVTFSGCPGGSPQDHTPNWITAAWPPEYAKALRWQWEERLIPYWNEAAGFASTHGVKVALEAHPGFAVYNVETMLRLRAETGPSIGINLDPSHLWWQGMDIPTAIAALGEAIFQVHAKDVALHPANIARNGVLDTKSYARMAERSWLFRSVGWGHSELDWKTIVSALRLVGYDYVLSIEHEDALASIHEGLDSAVSLLSRALLREPPVEAWWA